MLRILLIRNMITNKLGLINKKPLNKLRQITALFLVIASKKQMVFMPKVIYNNRLKKECNLLKFNKETINYKIKIYYFKSFNKR